MEEHDDEKSAEASLHWDGVTLRATYSAAAVAVRDRLAENAKSYAWGEVLVELEQHRELANSTRLDGRSAFTPLHQAAHGAAPEEVVRRMLELGAWRTVRTAAGERAVDIARRRAPVLVDQLEPRLAHRVSTSDVTQLREHLHDVIRARAGDLVREHALRLPEIEPLTEYERARMWFPIPGMYGGFAFWLDASDSEPRIIAESWCRVVGGSGQRHEITSRGARLVDEGFG